MVDVVSDTLLLGHVQLKDLQVRLPLPSVDVLATGSRIWAGGLLLAAYLAEQDAGYFAGRSVLELGCGAFALPSAVCALRLGPLARCCATDGEPSVAVAAQRCLQLNGVTADVECFSWAEIDQVECELAWEHWDIILFADGVYTVDAGPLLARCIEAGSRSSDCEIVGAVGAHRCGSVELLREMARLGFVAKHIQDGTATLRESIDNGHIFTMRDGAEGPLNHIAGTSSSFIIVLWHRAPTDRPSLDDECEHLVNLLEHLRANTSPEATETHDENAVEMAEKYPRVTVGVW